MQRLKTAVVGLLIATAIPVFAQTAPPAAAGSESPDAPRTPLPYDRGYDKDSPRTDAINDSGRAGVEDANNAIAAQSAAQSRTGGVDTAQYSDDMAAYRDALRARRHTINSDARVYDRQQRAYADAMADWREQVYACEHGSNRACNAPTPNPADYW